MSYGWTAVFASGSRKAGLYLAGQDNSGVHHGSSYLVWQTESDLYLYKYVNNLPQGGSYKVRVNLSVSAGTRYTYRVSYDPTTGQLWVWRNGTAVLQWTDPTPLTGGNYISLRTGYSQVIFDDVYAHQSEGLTYLYTDHLGSTSLLRDSNGNIIPGSTTRYLPFGDYRGPAPSQTRTDRDFTGQRENRELGLLYYQARYYLPGIGRFASADTLVPDPANPQAYNRYTYALNSPLRYTDPTGHVCYDPGLDAVMPGNCNGGSTPLPSSPPPPPRSHKGSDSTTFPGFELSEDDLLLLTLGVFAENQNASHPSQAMELWTWLFLSKLARNPESDIYAIIESSSGAWNDYDFVEAHRPFRGDPHHDDPVMHRAWLLNAANFYMNGSSQNASNFQALFTQITGENIEAFDGGIYDQWRIYGTNSIADPTYGAIFAVHRAENRFINELGPLFVDYAQVNPTFSYVFSPPYQGIMTVVGNAGCIYDHTLCQ